MSFIPDHERHPWTRTSHNIYILTRIDLYVEIFMACMPRAHTRTYAPLHIHMAFAFAQYGIGSGSPPRGCRRSADARRRHSFAREWTTDVSRVRVRAPPERVVISQPRSIIRTTAREHDSIVVVVARAREKYLCQKASVAEALFLGERFDSIASALNTARANARRGVGVYI